MYYGNPEAESPSNFGWVFKLGAFEDGGSAWQNVDWGVSVGVDVEVVKGARGRGAR